MCLFLWMHCNLLLTLIYHFLVYVICHLKVSWHSKTCIYKPKTTDLNKDSYRVNIRDRTLVFKVFVLKMYLRNTLNCIILPILLIVTKKLLLHVKGNPVNLTDVFYDFHGHNVDPVEMMQTMQIMMQMDIGRYKLLNVRGQRSKFVHNLNFVVVVLLS